MTALMTKPVVQSLRKEVDRFFDRVWEGRPEPAVLAVWHTPVDVSDTTDAVTAQIELPGADPKDIRVSIKDQTLFVRGEKKREIELKDANFSNLERCYGTILRSIDLPWSVDPATANATFKNGVLTVKVDKAADAKGTSIAIKVM